MRLLEELKSHYGFEPGRPWWFTMAKCWGFALLVGAGLTLVFVGFMSGMFWAVSGCATAKEIKCAPTILKNYKEKNEWTQADTNALQRAAYVCERKYNGCLKKFYVYPKQRYRAICGAVELYPHPERKLHSPRSSRDSGKL